LGCPLLISGTTQRSSASLSVKLPWTTAMLLGKWLGWMVCRKKMFKTCGAQTQQKNWPYYIA
jgi:hypothetical protein